MAQAALIQGVQRPLRIPCARETMKSIEDSVHALLSDQVKRLRLEGHYKVRKTYIEGVNGTEFIFLGLRDLSIHNVKSLEGADILICEEAQNITKKSWNTVIPTLRKPGNEIWIAFNPRYANDDTYQRWVVHPDPRAVVVQTSWRDNPWFSEESRLDMEADKVRDYEDYLHIWEGQPQSTVVGAIYRAEIAAAEQGQRITRVQYDPFAPVDTFWDLGFGDMVSIWFAQVVAMQNRVIDYHQDSGKAIDHYLQILQSKGYTYGQAHLPWDGGSKQLGSGRSIEEIMRGKGFKARVLPRWLIADGINAVRTIFPTLWFDAGRCSVGLQGLREYQWGAASATGIEKREPLHNEASHPADALRALAVALKAPVQRKPPVRTGPRHPVGVWS
ncbi:MAG: phage terminase large subunit [Bryobacteraceae bacterium]